MMHWTHLILFPKKEGVEPMGAKVLNPAAMQKAICRAAEEGD